MSSCCMTSWTGGRERELELGFKCFQMNSRRLIRLHLEEVGQTVGFSVGCRYRRER